MQRKFTDEEISEALRAGGHEREKAWEYLYKTWRNVVIGFLHAYECPREQALEIFQEVALPFERAICVAGFKMNNAKLQTYFITCVYNRWLKRRQQTTKTATFELQDNYVREVAQSVETHIISSELASILDATLAQIGARCKTILQLFMNQYKMQEIAESMGFANAQIAKNEKLKCQMKFEDFLSRRPDILKQIEDLRYG